MHLVGAGCENLTGKDYLAQLGQPEAAYHRRTRSLSFVVLGGEERASSELQFHFASGLDIFVKPTARSWHGYAHGECHVFPSSCARSSSVISTQTLATTRPPFALVF